MKYAIFADIHGNIHALEAALADAGTHGADKYIFLGDYYRECPWPNEVAEAIRKLPSATVIRGNGEGYLTALKGQNQSEWTHEQYKLAYWNYRALTRDNLDYLTALPETAVLSEGGHTLYLSHSSNVFFRSPKIPFFSSMGFRLKMEAAPFSHEEYLVTAKNALLSCPGAARDIHALPKGIYLFGHNHLQFHMEYDGRLFINPGSCGSPLDYDTTAAYTLLTCTDDAVTVLEKRVEYDLDAAIEALRNSDFAAYAPVWSKLMECELISGRECIAPFLNHVTETATRFGRSEFPVGNDVWDAAVKTYPMDKT